MRRTTLSALGSGAQFHRLHHLDQPLLLPNAWDHASAAALVERGFAAVGTTSLGIAAAAGLPDASGVTREQTVALAHGLVRLDALISVDIEGGFGGTPEEVASLTTESADAGVVGINQLAELGVRRVSCGSLLFREALRSAVETAWSIAYPDAESGGLPFYADAQALADRFSRPA